ncbi:uncharacterized protein LOC128222562 isoform X1 [Mya arenaria]|uniref:uncharacterized protein LOC128222562 isoform X1 n=1 Tax=Mya arenaria TaxID=6604 RepID=UPI0022DFC0F3|nr:uncharacterized protein LOC128222562 isoform X1 [Mya arenaria]
MGSLMSFFLLATIFVKGSATQTPTLIATGIFQDQTITLTCHINGGTARSVGWYRNQGRKVISIGNVGTRCETSPPELPFSAICLCLNTTVFSCTLTVELSMHNGDEWECSFADNELSIKSNEIRISGSNPSRTGTGRRPDRQLNAPTSDKSSARSMLVLSGPISRHRMPRASQQLQKTVKGHVMCSVEVNNSPVEILVSSNAKRDILNVYFGDIYVGNCDTVFKKTEIEATKYKQQFNLSITRNGQCVFTIFKIDVKQAIVRIYSEAKALTTVLVNGKVHPGCKDPSKQTDTGVSAGVIAGIVVGAVLIFVAAVVVVLKIVKNRGI